MNMTVASLIAALEKIEDKTKKVETEGCDGDGDVASVEDEDERVYLRRTPR